jgi:hypothetical protein
MAIEAMMKPAVIFKTGLKLILYLRSNGYMTTCSQVSPSSFRIKILQQIVWSAVQRHGPGLRDEIVPDLDPAHEVERQEQEELSKDQIP